MAAKARKGAPMKRVRIFEMGNEHPEKPKFLHKSQVTDGRWHILCDPENWIVSLIAMDSGQVTCPDCLRLLRAEVARLSEELK